MSGDTRRGIFYSDFFSFSFLRLSDLNLANFFSAGLQRNQSRDAARILTTKSKNCTLND